MKRRKVDHGALEWLGEARLAILERRLRDAGGADCFRLIAEGAEAVEDGVTYDECRSNLVPTLHLCWDKLHCGHWKDVDDIWRDTYTLCQLLLVRTLDDEKEAMRRLDLALILGGPLFRQDALKAAADQSAVIKRASESSDPACSADSLEFEPDLGLLPPRSLAGGEIERVAVPSLEDFLVTYFTSSQPIVITGLVQDWPAWGKWGRASYLKAAAGERTVPIEVGANYLDAHWTQKLTTVADFVDQHLRPEEAGRREGSPGSQGKEAGREMGYLAQYALFDHIPELKRDILTPDYCTLGEGEVKAVNAWLGPSGTTTPFHFDKYHNLLAQVVGFKYLRLVHPDHSSGLYPHKRGMNTNASRVDVDRPSEDEFPMYSSLQFKECVLRPGEVLYIPPRWWHFVRSLSVSFSVSFWWT